MIHFFTNEDGKLVSVLDKLGRDTRTAYEFLRAQGLKCAHSSSRKACGVVDANPDYIID